MIKIVLQTPGGVSLLKFNVSTNTGLEMVIKEESKKDN